MIDRKGKGRATRKHVLLARRETRLSLERSTCRHGQVPEEGFRVDAAKGLVEHRVAIAVNPKAPTRPVLEKGLAGSVHSELSVIVIIILCWSGWATSRTETFVDERECVCRDEARKDSGEISYPDLLRLAQHGLRLGRLEISGAKEPQKSNVVVHGRAVFVALVWGEI